MKIQNKTARLATTGIMIALAFILSRLEALLPPLTGIPGIKPGFANIVSMTALYVLGPGPAICISLVRVVLAGITFGSLSSMIYGLAGATVSLSVMLLLKKLKCFSLPAISIAGGTAHNLGQLLLACFVLGPSISVYLPVLVLSGAAAGFITGIITALAVKALPAS